MSIFLSFVLAVVITLGVYYLVGWLTKSKKIQWTITILVALVIIADATFAFIPIMKF